MEGSWVCGELQGAEALSALRRWQPSVTPAVAVAWPEATALQQDNLGWEMTREDHVKFDLI